MTAPASADLFPAAAARADGTVHINRHCLIRSSGDRRVVVVRGLPVAAYAVGDRMAEGHAMVLLVDQGYAQQLEVAKAFGCTTRTVRRCEARFAAGGLAALGRQPGFPTGRLRRQPARDQAIVRLRQQGLSNRAAARQLGVHEKTVRKALRRQCWQEPQADRQQVLDFAVAADRNLSGPAAAPATARPIDPAATADPNLSALATAPATASPVGPAATADPNLSAAAHDADVEPLAPTLDNDPSDRRLDRFMAYIGALDDARPLFQAAPRVHGAGVLLAVPALLDTGVLRCARRVFGSLGPAFYGLRSTVLTLLLMALLRIRRPENLKETCPIELGRVLGLDRAPEMKTVRRKLARLAAVGRAAEFGRALARERARTHGEALGSLYIDGHVRVYHGKHKLPKAHVTQLRIALPATTDYWVNDRDGTPLFVVTAEANAGLCAMLPLLLAEMRPLLGDRRATVVFDRGGYSPTLFKALSDKGFDVLTYRKGKAELLPAADFSRHQGDLDGRKVAYQLADSKVELSTRGGGKLKMRQVTRLSDDGAHQTHILTTLMELPAVEVAWRMFERWRQENFFKYLKDEFALDAVSDYGVEPDDPARLVPNPARKPLDVELLKLNRELETPETALALRASIDPRRLHDPEFRATGQAILDKLRRRIDLRQARDALPTRVPVGQTTTAPIVHLAGERKLLTSQLKMVAYQAETELIRLLAPHYKRTEDDGRTLVQTLLAAPAALDVTGTELRVCLAPLNSPHLTRAAAALCRELDQRGVMFPGTRLRLVFRVDE